MCEFDKRKIYLILYSFIHYYYLLLIYKYDTWYLEFQYLFNEI